MQVSSEHSRQKNALKTAPGEQVFHLLHSIFVAEVSCEWRHPTIFLLLLLLLPLNNSFFLDKFSLTPEERVFEGWKHLRSAIALNHSDER